MVEKEVIHGKSPFSAAIKVKDTIYVSGQIPKDFVTGDWPVNIEDQTKQCLKNIKKILLKVGADISNIVKITIYFTNIEEYGKMNKGYIEFFNNNGIKTNFPARSCVQVGPLMFSEWHVEIDCIAIL